MREHGVIFASSSFFFAPASISLRFVFSAFCSELMAVAKYLTFSRRNSLALARCASITLAEPLRAPYSTCQCINSLRHSTLQRDKLRAAVCCARLRQTAKQAATLRQAAHWQAQPTRPRTRHSLRLNWNRVIRKFCFCFAKKWRFFFLFRNEFVSSSFIFFFIFLYISSLLICTAADPVQVFHALWPYLRPSGSFSITSLYLDV